MTSSATEGAATTPTAHEYRHTRQIEIALRSGLRLRATQWGTAAPTCVLLHGFGEGSHVWTKFIHSLVPMFRAITIDLRGHGDSDWDAAGDYSSATHVSD